MKLIADSGASKTDWILFDGSHEPKQFQTQGLNPFYIDTKGIETVLAKELIPFIDYHSIREIHFYGAGCSSVYNNMLVEDAFLNYFSHIDIQIDSDLLGAARALLGKEEGIACILGTGSNSSLYDGNKIVCNIPSLGYFFGDEGSGSHLGKLLCSDFMLHKLPGDLDKAFKEKYSITRENILHAVYRMSFPNRFLATFSEFYTENKSHPYIIGMLNSSFQQFFSNTVEKYQDYADKSIRFVGSIAYFFRENLNKAAESKGIKIDSIVRSPVEGLINYHS